MERPAVCNCPKTKCVRHGNCEQCEAYHRERNNRPYCRREKGIFRKLFSK